jgi:hypothetical protein
MFIVQISQLVRRTLHNLLIELILSQSHLPGENATQIITFAVDAIHSFNFSVHQVPITAG